MVYKTKLMVGIPSLTHIPMDILLRSYIYSLELIINEQNSQCTDHVDIQISEL